jgi:nucleoside-diphosphate-sugar epimerase
MSLIIGCGYIGEALALTLSDCSNLTVTCKSDQSYSRLKKTFSDVHVLDYNDVCLLKNLLENKHTVILTVAAKGSSDYRSTYLEAALSLKWALEFNQSVKQLIYTSTTSVYGECYGRVVDETSTLNAESEASKILIETENILLSLQTSERRVCIFRLSEIYGPNREISQRVRHLQSKKAPGDGLSQANMIHQADIVSAIIFACKNHLCGVYNLSDDERISRKSLYEKISEKFKLPQVIFDPTLRSHHMGSKIVSNEKIKKAGFIFTYPQRALI